MPQEIRDAAPSFKANSAGSFDGINVKHFAVLCGDALESMAYLIEAAERLGTMPRQLGLVPVILLGNPKVECGPSGPTRFFTGFG